MEFHIIQKQETTFCYETNLHLFFALSGRSNVTIGDTVHELLPEGILGINPCTLYRVDCMEGSLLLLSISESELKRSGNKKGNGYAFYVRDGNGLQPEFEKIRQMLAVLLYEYLQHSNKRTKEPRQSLLMEETLQALLIYLREQFRNLQEPRSLSSAVGEKAAEFLSYIDHHWDEDISLALLAEKAHFSASYLSRFFQRTLGIQFSAYLRKVRMIHACRMLRYAEDSVTAIAYNCGFHNTSVFIEAFKQEYGMTPGQYRQEQSDRAQKNTGQPGLPESEHDQRSDFSVLLAHMPETPSDETGLRREFIEVDCRDTAYITDHGSQNTGSELNKSIKRNTAPLDKNNQDAGISRKKTDEKKSGVTGRCSPWKRILNIGYAKDGLVGPVRDQIRQAQEEIGFTWFRCHGLLDEDMYVYREEPDGTPVFSFAYVDALLDFVTELGLRPFIELSFMPPQLALRQTRIFDRPSIISGCADLSKWSLLIRTLLTHLQERYGIEALRSWRFSTISLSYVRIGCLLLEEFSDLYLTTYKTVKAFDAGLSFGGAGCFPDLFEDEEIGMPWFLRFVIEKECIPDFHSVQWYPCIQTDDILFMEYTMNQHAAPALLSRDPDYLRNRLDVLDALYSSFHVEDRELFLEECTSTLWQRDLSSDTCYKAVWMAHNMVLSAGRAVFGYWLLTDFMEERAGIRSVFHGGYGLFTYNGIPKAGYHALHMISSMGQSIVSQGNGWILTQNNTRTYSLLVYNYSHYSDLNCYRYKQLDSPSDAYSVFLHGDKMELDFSLHGLPPGPLQVIRTRLTREHGSAFDQWLRLRAPASPTRDEIHFLKHHSEPLCHMETVPCSGTFLFSVILMPLEMELVQLKIV